MNGRGRTRAAALIVATLTTAGSQVLVPTAAHAACHIAAFTETDHRVREDAGSVRLTVHLVGGQPSCAGSVSYETRDGTARAGVDYVAAEGELTFVAGDNRRASFNVTIIDDDVPGPNSRFTVHLTGGTGDLQPDPTPARVTILDDDEEAPPPDADQETTPIAASPIGTEGGSNAGLIAGIVGALAALVVIGAMMIRRRRPGAA